MREEDEDDPYRGLAQHAHLAWIFFLIAMLFVLLVATLFWTGRARAASDGYCQLWARAVTEIEVRTGQQFSLIFLDAELAFTATKDVDIATADAYLIEMRLAGHRHSCAAVPEYDSLPLPDVPFVRVANWAANMALLAVGRQGTVPATEKPAVSSGWAEACAAEYRTFDPDDQTVIRRGSPDRVKCPLVEKNGEWIIPR